jgi:cytoskeletal protein CcmA (bactofilin family)
VVWKKPEEYPAHPEPAPPPRPAAPPSPEARRAERPVAVIGPSIFIKGDLSGDEDLVIEGRVEGKIDLKQHNVTIGKNGRVHADVFGNTVVVEGEVDGNLFASQQAVLRQSGAVRGNITAPRVMLEDGSRFRGSIDMEEAPAKAPGATTAAHGGGASGAAAGGAGAAGSAATVPGSAAGSGSSAGSGSGASGLAAAPAAAGGSSAAPAGGAART